MSVSIPGFTYVHVPIPDELHAKATEHKAAEAWPTYVARLIANDIETTERRKSPKTSRKLTDGGES